MIDLEKRHIEKIIEVVNRIIPGFQVSVFGSRVKKGSWRYSDIDILVSGERALTSEERFMLRDEFDESDIPVIVDIIDRFEISDEFSNSIEDECVRIR